jgi:hypothetical protein
MWVLRLTGRLFVFQGWLVGALLDVETGVGEAQVLDGTVVEEVFGDNLRDVFDVDEAIPDGFGVDHNDGTVLALVEAARFVSPDVALQASFLDGVFEG